MTSLFMAANLHITHNNAANASRILRITESIVKGKIADYVYIVGKLDGEIPEIEHVDAHREIWRILLVTRNLPKNLIFQLIKYIEFSVAILIRYRKKNIRMVNCHSLSVLPIGALFKLFYGTKLIYDTHELETETYGLNGFRKTLSKLVEKYLISFVDHTFVVSEDIAAEYARLYDIKRPTVVLNCPNQIADKSSDYFRKKFCIRNDARVFLYQGVMSEGRGIQQILNAFSAIENSEKSVVVFLGYGPLTNRIVDYSKKYANIFFHEAVPPESILKFTCSADVGLSLIRGSCLSYEYCLPNKLFEYIMAGLPVIVSDLPEMAKLVAINRIGLVFKGNNSASLRKMIENIDNSQISIMKDNTAIAAKKYNWEVQELKMLQAYQKLN